MPMLDAGLSDAIKAEIIVQNGAPADAAKLQKFCDAVGKAVVEYIKANALVSSTGVVTSGAGAGGAVTASGTVT